MHIHLLGKLRRLSEQSQKELFYLIRNDVVYIIKPEEVDELIKEGIIEHKNDVIQVRLYGLTCLIHTYNSRCLLPNKYVKLICRAKNYWKSEDNTKHVLIDLPNSFSKPCIKLLEKSGLATLTRNECDENNSFKSHLDYFHPKKHILPWKYGDDKSSP